MINILISTYNGEKFISEQLDSLIEQTVQDFVVLIRDDGSTDSTVDIIKEYENRYPDKIIFIHDNLGNLGSSKSFMKLLEYSDKEYIMFCDQDDIWVPNKIELSLNKIKELEGIFSKDIPLLVFTDLMVVDENLNIISKSFRFYQKLDPQISTNWKKLLAQNVITGCTMIINRKAKEVCLPYLSEIMMYDHWIGVNVAKYGKIGWIDIPTVLYRQHRDNVAGAHKYGIKYIANKLRNIDKILNYLSEAPKYFEKVSFIELILTKAIVNFKRSVVR